MKNLSLIIIVCLSYFCNAQYINKDKIKNSITNQNSSFYYPKLIEDFTNDPSRLYSDTLKVQYLYYGKLYSDYYKRKSEIKPDYFRFIKLTNSGKYKKALNIGESLLKKDPVNLVVLLHMITCYKNLDIRSEEFKKVEMQAEILLKTIAFYGDGKSKEKSFKVISLGDEFALLNYLNIDLDKFTRTSETIQPDIILDIWTKNKNYKEDRRDIVYFSVLLNDAKKN